MERNGNTKTVRTLYVLHFTTTYKDSLLRNFGPENPKNIVINNQS